MLGTFKEAFIFVLVATVITGVVAEVMLSAIVAIVRDKSWWPRAAPLQKALMMNFGFPESWCPNEALVDCYAYVLVLCSHHTLCGLLTLPVVVSGWEVAGPTGQACMLIAVLMDVSVAVYDEIKMFCRTFLFKAFEPIWPVPCPKEFFVIMGVLHHPLAMIMAVPVVLYYPHLRAFHLITCSLLFAAGIGFTAGSYKFTLDVRTPAGLYQYKAIVLLQTVTIFYSRGYVWFAQLYAALSTFSADGSTGFLVGGLVAGAAMSLFNLVVIMDAAQAAIKWLPAPLPYRKAGPLELEEAGELRREILKPLLRKHA